LSLHFSTEGKDTPRPTLTFPSSPSQGLSDPLTEVVRNGARVAARPSGRNRLAGILGMVFGQLKISSS
jgi:hypothetical protein